MSIQTPPPPHERLSRTESTGAAQQAELAAVIVPAAVVMGGLVSCGALWMISTNPAIRAAGLFVLVSDIVIALLLRKFFLKRLNSPKH